FFADDDFDEAICLIHCDGFSGGLEGEFTYLVFAAGFLCLLFGHTDAGDLRATVSTAGEFLDLLGLPHAKHTIDSIEGFEGRNVCQPRWADDVACRVDALDGGFVAIVYLDVVLLHLQLNPGGE